MNGRNVPNAVSHVRMLRALAVFIVILLSACGQLGPERIELGRGHYNIAVQRTDDEQFLLNLVRLRYRDTPYFLQVASVSTNFTFEVTGDASGGVGFAEADSSSFGLGISGRATESPTVTYTPLHGDQFVKQLLSPINLSTILLLYHSGWAINRLFNVTVQYINGVPNAPSASGPTPAYIPEHKEFHRATALLRSLQQRGLVTLGQTQTADDARALVLRFASEAIDMPEPPDIVALLGLPKGKTDYILTARPNPSNANESSIVTRSLMASLFYVSQGVHVPIEDEEAGRVTVTRDAETSRVFDWNEVTGDLMQVHSSAAPPDNAAVRVRYRGHWFFIDDSDLNSKATFALLTNLFALQAGEIPSTAPILTLPVAR